MSDSLAGLTPEQLASIPAGRPPPGIQPNLVDPPTAAPVLIIVSTILMVIMLFIAGVRFYVKAFVRKKINADDWTTLVAVVRCPLLIESLGTICIGPVTRAKFGTHMWDISVAQTLSDDFLIASFFTNWPTGLVWAFAKTSFFIMYLHIFRPLVWLRRCVYLGLFVNWGFYTAVVIASIYYQAPNPGQTWQEGFMNARYNQSFNMTIPIASGSLVLDTYIFVLPLFAIQSLRLSSRKKLGVMAVFATGSMACVASSLSIYFKYKLDLHLDDYTYWIYPVLLMALVEMCVGISCSCMPSAAGFFKNRSGNMNSWGSSAFSALRSLFRHESRHRKGYEDYQDSWKSTPPGAAMSDIEMMESRTHLAASKPRLEPRGS
ncbi:hypothetical protein SUNI508_14028 [Seiridium unicorne]|uniref:Rhodopsin domain-containing protein n=1 Tax=Seiridium unicorne TaxID=138068 RepID=A0ABR2VA08_9PEZI